MYNIYSSIGTFIVSAGPTYHTLIQNARIVPMHTIAPVSYIRQKIYSK